MPHIPQGTTDTVALELFDPALDAALRPSPDYDVSRWLYVPNTYSEYRYILGTRGQKPLICVGINPSTAAPDALDPTLQSAQRIALNNGYDSFLMFNVYAQRATRPDDMERVLQQRSPRREPESLPLSSLPFRRPLLSGPPGGTSSKSGITSWTVCGISPLTVRPQTLNGSPPGRLLKSGHPHHPLYLKSTTALQPFDIDAYLRR